jgi:hypothetical protein
MASVNIQRTTQQTRILDEYYNTELVVSTEEYDLVVSFFKRVMADPDVAETFASNLFKISKDTGVSVLTYLENIKNQNELELNLTFSYYLNSTRSNSTLLGVGQVITPNYYAARNVVI